MAASALSSGSATKTQSHQGEPAPIPDALDRIAGQIVDAAFRVHSTLGPGLLESVYETCVCHELQKRNLAFQRQVALPVVYDGLRLEAGLRIDLIVADEIIVEIKAANPNPVFVAQLLTYMKLSERRLGLLINFNVARIKEGIKRVAL